MCAALILATLAAYWGLGSHGFVLLDDDKYVTENAQVKMGLTQQSAAWAFTSTHATNWHPVTWLSHMLDVRLFGLDAGRHHLTSLFLHILNAVLLLLLLYRATGALWRSALVAALFALHPLHVESVAWIAERKDVLSTLFGLLTLLAWLGYVRSGRAVSYALAIACYALGLMAKPMLVTLPFTLLLLDYWPLGRLRLPLEWRSGALRSLLLEKAPLFAMSAASCVITAIAQRGAMQDLVKLPLTERAANAMQSYAGYLGNMLWPSGLAVFYPHPHAALFGLASAAALVLLATVTLLALRMAGRAPYLLFGWLWYLGTLVPVIGLVQVGAQSMADRYTYVPLIGIFIAAAWGLADLVKGNRALRLAAAAVAVAALAALFALTRVQTAYWADNEALFGHAVEVTSGNWLAHDCLGLSITLSGTGREEEAIAHFEEALKIDPGHPNIHNNLAAVLLESDRLDEAAIHYREALKLRPGAPVPLRNLGLILLKSGRVEEALDCLARAVEADPGSAESRLHYGQALDRAGRLPEALEQFQKALGADPGSAKALNALGIGLRKAGRPDEAMERFAEAVRIKPDYADARINLGVALDHAGRTREAVEHFEEAVRLRPGSAQALDNLGLALTRLDRLPEATAHFQEAVAADPAFADARRHLGIALARAGRLSEAVEQLREAVRLRPDDGQARAALDGVTKALRTGR